MLGSQGAYTVIDTKFVSEYIIQSHLPDRAKSLLNEALESYFGEIEELRTRLYAEINEAEDSRSKPWPREPISPVNFAELFEDIQMLDIYWQYRSQEDSEQSLIQATEQWAESVHAQLNRAFVLIGEVGVGIEPTIRLGNQIVSREEWRSLKMKWTSTAYSNEIRDRR